MTRISVKTCGTCLDQISRKTARKWNGAVIDALLERRPPETDARKPDYNRAMVAGPRGWELPWWYGKQA